MSFIKKLGAFVGLLVACGYLANLWSAHVEFERTGEKLVRQLGSGIVSDLGKFSPACRAAARIDSVSMESDWFLAQKGSATLYLSGQNDSAVAIRYLMETSGGKVYVQPQDQASARLSIMQFGLKGCS